MARDERKEVSHPSYDLPQIGHIYELGREKGWSDARINGFIGELRRQASQKGLEIAESEEQSPSDTGSAT